jgi:hypothetical protein
MWRCIGHVIGATSLLPDGFHIHSCTVEGHVPQEFLMATNLAFLCRGQRSYLLKGMPACSPSSRASCPCWAAMAAIRPASCALRVRALPGRTGPAGRSPVLPPVDLPERTCEPFACLRFHWCSCTLSLWLSQGSWLRGGLTDSSSVHHALVLLSVRLLPFLGIYPGHSVLKALGWLVGVDVVGQSMQLVPLLGHDRARVLGGS